MAAGAVASATPVKDPPSSVTAGQRLGPRAIFAAAPIGAHRRPGMKISDGWQSAPRRGHVATATVVPVRAGAEAAGELETYKGREGKHDVLEYGTRCPRARALRAPLPCTSMRVRAADEPGELHGSRTPRGRLARGARLGDRRTARARPPRRGHHCTYRAHPPSCPGRAARSLLACCLPRHLLLLQLLDARDPAHDRPATATEAEGTRRRRRDRGAGDTWTLLWWPCSC